MRPIRRDAHGEREGEAAQGWQRLDRRQERDDLTPRPFEVDAHVVLPRDVIDEGGCAAGKFTADVLRARAESRDLGASLEPDTETDHARAELGLFRIKFLDANAVVAEYSL